jgi:hypothetical protein
LLELEAVKRSNATELHGAHGHHLASMIIDTAATRKTPRLLSAAMGNAAGLRFRDEISQ